MKSMRKRNKIFMLVICLLFISIGYAFTYTDLKLRGTAGVTKQSWNIYFDNLSVTEGSVTPVTAASLSGEYPTTITYSVRLENPGDFYEFEVDAVNDGSIDAMIQSISSTDNDSEISLPSYIEYKATYNDDIELGNNHLFKAQTTERYRVGIYFKKDINASQLQNSQVQDLNLKFEVTYAQADENAIKRP